MCPVTITRMLFVPNTKNEDKCVTLLFLDTQAFKLESIPTYFIKLFHPNPATLVCFMYENNYRIDGFFTYHQV
jgi:hypothetical protein